MFSHENEEIVMDVSSDTLTGLMVKAIENHTLQFGENYLHELMAALGEMLGNGDTEYTRTEFSDPESNFTLKLIGYEPE